MLQPLSAAEYPEHPLITFSELSRFNPESLPKNVRIRGFLYQAKDGRLILASEPNLRSCCVASPAKLSSQIVVQGAIEVPRYGQAVLIEGMLSSAQEVFKLFNAVLVKENHDISKLGVGGVALLILIGIFLFYKKLPQNV